MNKKNVLQFTKILSQYLNSNISLKKSLNRISLIKNISKTVSCAAKEIEEQLERGSEFSLSLSQCSSIHFPKEYIAFVSVSEATGNLKETLSFLLKREELFEKRKSDLISSCIYPVFVIMLAFIGSILIVKYSGSIVPNISGKFNEMLFRKQAMTGVIKANLFLFVTCCSGIIFLYKKLGTNSELDLFRSLNFMADEGIDLHLSLIISMNVVNGNRFFERKILEAVDNLERGKSVADVFECFNSVYATSFFLAEDCNDIRGCLKNIVKESERKEISFTKITMSLIEPAIMVVIAAYIIILLKMTVMPVLFNYGF